MVTLVWMLAECAVSLYAAAQSRSVALLAFGSDSLIELLSAIVVLMQFLPRFALRKTHAARIAAVLLLFLAAAIVCISVLGWHHRVKPSPLGIGITVLALIAMPVLAMLKRRQAHALDNRALAADATQSAACAWLAAVTLAGLAMNALWRVSWVDSAAAILAVPILIVEARRTWRGDSCACGCAA